MANFARGVNPEIIEWARIMAGYSINEVAQSMKKDPELILSWENGEAVPTYNQLERLAYTLYKRPLALFFFPAPPEEISPSEAFRTLPSQQLEQLQPDTRHAIRNTQAIQLALADATGGRNPSRRLIISDIKVDPNSSLPNILLEIREYLGVTFENQINVGNTSNALDLWRAAVEDSGIFIIKRPMKQGDISGFCLYNKEFPIICINSSTSKTRQIFSIFHELAHLLIKSSGVTFRSTRYIEFLDAGDRSVEIFCNMFAAEFLVPSPDFEKQIRLEPFSYELVKQLAKRYKVSREVILRKFLDRGMISSNEYEEKALEWIEEYRKWKEGRSPGGDYYATQASYWGDKILSIYFGNYFQGKISVEQLADNLNMKVSSVLGLESFFIQKVA